MADSFTSLLLASERKQPFDDVIGTGDRNSLSITALPKGTSRSNYPGYEEVKIPATLTSAMGPNEKLVTCASAFHLKRVIFFSKCTCLCL